MQRVQPVITFLSVERSCLLFAFLSFQDPVDPASTVIVIRSLVPGGIAEKDGRLLPGDRLMFVNDVNLENSSLEEAVQALKGAPSGTVRIGVAKPLPVRTQILLISFYLQIKVTFSLFASVVAPSPNPGSIFFSLHFSSLHSPLFLSLGASQG